MRPETIITLNKPSFRADEPITGFVDIDTNQTALGPGQMEDKLWVIKVRLVGYAQMDTQWEDQARNPNKHDKARYETLPVEDREVTVRSTEVPVYVKPGVATRVRSIPFRIELSPSTIISSYNAQKGLFLVDYLLTATSKRKCPQSGWLLNKLESRTFVTITPPERDIERPLQVTPYSPPLDEMDLFRCPFMQTIRFNYAGTLTPSALAASHKMSLYFPLPLYEPEDIELSLTSTLTLRHNQIVNRHTQNTELSHQTYYRPDTGGEEVLIEFEVPETVPQTMDFKFAKGTMSMTHTLRVTMKVKLFPGDKAKCTAKNWSVDLPVTIRGQHYVAQSPSLPKLTSPSLPRSGPSSPEATRANSLPLSHKASETSEVSWIQDRFSTVESTDGEDNETAPPSATMSATSSFGQLSGYSETVAESSSSSARGSSSSSPTRRRNRVVNDDDVPPQKPAPTGPLPQPPVAGTRSPTPSPVQYHSPMLQQRNVTSPTQTQTRPATRERPAKKYSPDHPPQYPARKVHRGRSETREETSSRSRSTPAQDSKPDIALYDPFLVLTVPPTNLIIPAEPVPNPPSASSVSTKSSMPPTPTTQPELPAYYYGKRAPKLSIPQRGRSKSFGNTSQSPTSPSSYKVQSPPPSPPATMARVKFNPEISLSPSPEPRYPVAQSPPPRSRLPTARSPPLGDRFPILSASPTPAEVGYGMRSPPLIGRNIQRAMETGVQSPPSSHRTIPRASTEPGARSPPPSQRIPRAMTEPLKDSSSKQYSPQSRYTVPSSISSPTRVTSPIQSRLPPSSRQPMPPAPSRLPTSHSTISAPSRLPSQLPVPRPPLPSHAKARITSMSTATNTTATTSSRIPSISTATSQSRSNDTSSAAKVQLRRPGRPAAPSLFPPLPPATLAVQRENFRITQKGNSVEQSAAPTERPRWGESGRWNRAVQQQDVQQSHTWL